MELHGLYQLGHRVVRVEWSVADSRWDVTIEEVETGSRLQDRCDVLLSATGVLKYRLLQHSTICIQLTK